MNTKKVIINGKEIIITTDLDEKYMQDEVLVESPEDLEKTMEMKKDSLEDTFIIEETDNNE